MKNEITGRSFGKKTTFPPLDSNEEHEVLNAMLHHVYSDRDSIFIHDETYHSYLFPNTVEEMLIENNIEYESVMINDYINKNNNDYVLDPTKFTDPVVVVSSNPDALWLHRPGFNSDHTMAVVEFFEMSNPMVGAGAFALLEKVDEIWTLRFMSGTWIA